MTEKMSVMTLVDDILVGLTALMAFLAVLAALFFTGYSNGQKVQHMTQLCIERGHNGWSAEKEGCFD